MENFCKLFNNIKDYVGNNGSQDPKKTSNKFDRRYSTLFHVPHSDKLGFKTNIWIPTSHYDGKNIWLVKAPDLNRGRCIKIGNNLQLIQKLIKKFHEGIVRDFKDSCQDEDANSQSPKQSNKAKPSKEEGKLTSEKEVKKMKQEQANYGIGGKKYRTSLMLIQKCIEKPLLYYGRKFDIRIWVLFTQDLDVYAFKLIN